MINVCGFKSRKERSCKIHLSPYYFMHPCLLVVGIPLGKEECQIRGDLRQRK